MCTRMYMCVCACDESQARQGRARQDKVRQEGARRGEAGQSGARAWRGMAGQGQDGARARRGKGKTGQGQGKAREAGGSCASDLGTSQVSFSCFNLASLSIQVCAPFQTPFEKASSSTEKKSTRSHGHTTRDRQGWAGMGRTSQAKKGHDRARRRMAGHGGARARQGRTQKVHGGNVSMFRGKKCTHMHMCACACHESQARQGRTRQGKAGQGKPRLGKTRQGGARRGKAGQGGARRGKGKASEDEGGARRQHFNVRMRAQHPPPPLHFRLQRPPLLCRCSTAQDGPRPAPVMVWLDLG